MPDDSPDEYRARLRRTADEVRSWPAWKRGFIPGGTEVRRAPAPEPTPEPVPVQSSKRRRLLDAAFPPEPVIIGSDGKPLPSMAEIQAAIRAEHWDMQDKVYRVEEECREDGIDPDDIDPWRAMDHDEGGDSGASFIKAVVLHRAGDHSKCYHASTP